MAKLMAFIRQLAAQQQQFQQQLQQQQQQPTPGSATPVKTEPTLPTVTNGSTTNGSQSSETVTAVVSAEQSQQTKEPAVPPPQFSQADIATLRKQIHAFRLVSKNQPLPPQLRQELGSLTRLQRDSIALPAVLSAQCTRILKLTERMSQASRSSSYCRPCPSRINFVSPHQLLKEKLHGGEQAAQLQRLLVPSITPIGIDVRAMAQERERRRDARIEYRIKELSEMPANISDDRIDIAQEGGLFMRPGLITNAESSARLKSIIELKALGLRHKQRELRAEVVRGITRASQLGVAGDRTALRRMKKQSQREARLTEKMERQQRQERERREVDQHRQQLLAMTNHGANLVAWHKGHQQRMSKLGRSILTFHSHAEREEQKRKERIARERIQALKAGDEEAYLKLVDKEKDTRISHLLEQTDQFLSSLIDAVGQQKASDDDPDDAQTRDYFAVAHRVKEPIVAQPSILIGGQLKDYQLRGLNGILADEMGLGKTIQTISLVTYLIEKKQQDGPFLIIVPLSTITNWILEFAKWAPSVSVIGYKGNPTQRRTLQNQIRRGAFQAKIKWIHMIIDEGHRLKNTQSKLATILTTYYNTRYRLILTGTPLQNNLPELWALLNFVLPRVFSSVQSFDEWFNTPFAGAGGQDKIELNEEEQLLIIKRLHKVLRPFLLRRMKKDVEVDLPDKVEHVIKCSMSAVQSRLYHQMRKFGTLFPGVSIDKPGASTTMIMQLRKICNHPFVYDEVEARINPTRTNNNLAFELLDRVLAKLLATNHKVLIFFQMTQIMTIMEDFLTWRGIRSLRLDGSTSDDARREQMHTTRAGGQGLNLQTADTVVIFDSDWNPSADSQAMDRAHRIGQKNEVRILRLITTNSVEEKILARAEPGKFDQKSTAEEREHFLRSLLKADDNSEDSEGEDGANTDEDLNELLARSDEERVIFARMDEERRAQEKDCLSGCSLMPNCPEEYRHDYDPELERQRKEEEAVKDKARNSRRVYYDDGLSEEQWLDALEDDNKREKEERARKRKEEKLLQQHLRSKIGDIDSVSVGDDNDVPSEGASDTGSAARNPRKRGRPRRSGSGTSTMAQTPSGSGTAIDETGDVVMAESGDATPSSGGRSRSGRKRAKLDDDATGSSTPAGAATPSGGSRKGRRKGGAVDPLAAEERAQLNGVFEASFKAVEACIDPEYQRRRCDLFLEVPSKRDYPDYYMIIRHPIAMKNIRKKVRSAHYLTVEDFHKDWKLMFDNARTDACEMQKATGGHAGEDDRPELPHADRHPVAAACCVQPGSSAAASATAGEPGVANNVEPRRIRNP
ncbi:hypothetical protein DL89DRAFT_274414 [Linderina pennispora]|uniref:Uncharacterized protein n=1 Tax=Linderina pennispora TaxID=61395 RepID=A0A1Y1WCA2_9FUNG|nr:uncharacterized protein DL89DRAFT_274414 [Linderina pennispora]ORX71159.1 hypothetical protein DL89DRAFT_274414 [Linderina pennispora]